MTEAVHIKTTEDLNFDELESGEVHNLHVHLTDNALGVPWRVPVIVVKGAKPGPILGITAAMHGDELNGISTIFKLTEDISPEKLSGTLVMVPIANVPGYMNKQRYFDDAVDLNRIMPGKPEGATSAMYAHQLANKIIKKFDMLLDLHTASHGRVNTLYIRADLENEDTRTLAYLQNPRIIVQKYDEEGTLRGWANDNNIPSITIEIGNPNAFQHTLIDETLDGIMNTLRHFKMIDGEVQDLIDDAIAVDHSYWIYSKRGGIVDVLPGLTNKVKKGEVIAKVYDVFGQVKEEVMADREGFVIGKNISPACDAGTRILHLGVNEIEPLPENIPGHDSFSE